MIYPMLMCQNNALTACQCSHNKATERSHYLWLTTDKSRCSICVYSRDDIIYYHVNDSIRYVINQSMTRVFEYLPFRNHVLTSLPPPLPGCQSPRVSICLLADSVAAFTSLYGASERRRSFLHPSSLIKKSKPAAMTAEGERTEEWAKKRKLGWFWRVF